MKLKKAVRLQGDSLSSHAGAGLFRSVGEVAVLVEMEVSMVRKTDFIAVGRRFVRGDLSSRIVARNIAADFGGNSAGGYGPVLHDDLRAVAAAAFERNLTAAREIDRIFVPRSIAIHLHRLDRLLREVLADEFLRILRHLVEIDLLRCGAYGKCGYCADEKQYEFFHNPNVFKNEYRPLSCNKCSIRAVGTEKTGTSGSVKKYGIVV